MDDNLPPTNDNQQQDNLNINPPEPSTAPPVELSMPPMPEISETPVIPPTEPTENVTAPKSEIKPEEAKTEEQSIEIGALGNQPSFTSFNQEINTNSSSKPNKSKKIKTVSSVLGIVLIIAALPLSMILVKQRQEIRKEAASGTVTACGVTVSTAGYRLNNNGSYTGKYFLSNASGRNVEMTIRVDGCACDEGNLTQCNDNCSGEERNITVPPSGLPQEVTTPSKNDCGTFQTDIKVMSCRQL